MSGEGRLFDEKKKVSLHLFQLPYVRFGYLGCLLLFKDDGSPTSQEVKGF